MRTLAHSGGRTLAGEGHSRNDLFRRLLDAVDHHGEASARFSFQEADSYHAEAVRLLREGVGAGYWSDAQAHTASIEIRTQRHADRLAEVLRG